MGYFDLQVNGFAGVDFNQDDLTAEQLRDACRRLSDDGADAVLATVITEQTERMARRIARIVELRSRDELARRVIAGIHVEGPFLNPRDGFRGAHPLDAIRPADLDAMKLLLDAAGGLARIVTLAPEQDDGLRVTRWLAGKGVVVSAGHCDPTLDQLRGAIDAGLSMFTHLGNGCPMRMHRHENVIQRVLSLADRLWVSFIADGAHVPFYALGNYLQRTGVDRAIVVTDATAAAGLPPGRVRLGRWDVEIGEDRVARSPDGTHLIGSAITMRESRRRLADHLDLTAEQIDKLTCRNPRQAVRMQQRD